MIQSGGLNYVLKIQHPNQHERCLGGAAAALASSRRTSFMESIECNVQEQKQQELSPQVLTVDEVAELLRVNRKTVYEAISKGEIPGVLKIGRKIRISRQAVVDWLAGNGQSRPKKRRLP